MLITCQLVIVSNSLGQLNPSPSQFFFNDLLVSSAATGIEKSPKIGASFRNLVPNSYYFSPINYYTSFQAQFKNGSGIGVQFDGQRAGLLEKNRIILSYALSLIDGENKLRIGAGFGSIMSRVSTNSTFIRGEINDPAIFDFNNGRFNLDGSMGLQLMLNNGYNLLAGIPSLASIRMYSNYSSINYTLLNSLVKKKYKFGGSGDDSQSDGVVVEPMIGFRLMQGNKDIVDLGLMVDYKQQIAFISLFHTNMEYAIGVSFPVKRQFNLNFIYNSGKLYSKNYMNWGGTLEMSIGYKFQGNEYNK
jgi:hypothetical protein